MSEPTELIPSPPTSAMRKTLGKGNEQIFKNPNRPASDAALQDLLTNVHEELEIQEVSQQSDTQYTKRKREHRRGQGSRQSPSHVGGVKERKEGSRDSVLLEEVRHNTDEYMHLKRQLKELIKAERLSSIIKELKEDSEKDQPKAAKKVEAFGKDKAMTLSKSEKPNASIHRTPHWFQWRNHMANGTNIATGKNRGCGTFNLYMDELCGSNITISIQRDHRKARSKENSSSPINGSRNVKIPSLGGILTLRRSKIIPLECTMVLGPEAQPSASTRVAKEKIKVAIHPEYPEQTIAIGSTLTEKGRRGLCDLLRRNLDIFTWKPEDMTGVPRHIAEHRLNIREGCPPVR
ncbi:hypothetical protein Tco_0553818 [Tanacetum coccineum]